MMAPLPVLALPGIVKSLEVSEFGSFRLIFEIEG
jgi:hypothetical protein